MAVPLAYDKKPEVQIPPGDRLAILTRIRKVADPPVFSAHTNMSVTIRKTYTQCTSRLNAISIFTDQPSQANDRTNKPYSR